MANYTQDRRPLQLSTPLGKDKLLITGIKGREAVSSPFSYRIRMLSENQQIAGADLLRKAVSIRIERFAEGGDRHIHGFVNRFSLVGYEEELAVYEAEVVPWLWFASLRRNCRIFQDKSVPEIVEAILGETENNDFDIQATRSYPKRDYCVQYRESDLDFVNRLLEEEGLFYNFEHSDSAHRLVITDSNEKLASPLSHTVPFRRGRAPNIRDTSDDGGIHTLIREDSVFVGKVTLSDYDHLQPSLTLRTSMQGDGIAEVYEYPGNFNQQSEGDRYARIRLEAEEAQREIIRGEADSRSLHAGGSFTLDRHPSSGLNAKYLVLETTLSATQEGYRAEGHGEFALSCGFMAIPHATPYRSTRSTPRPVVRGSQTALVVGPAGEEIWVDKHGRVKVQFYWDREGQKNEDSSCWVRVSSLWAGKGWGAIHLPRMGQEVIVDFLEGDPDRPIVTGRVYNAEQTPPYALPGKQTQSGIKSRSSKNGTTDNFNEIRMEDAKGNELLYIHAEKNEHVVVEANRTLNVGHDETITVGNDRRKTIDANETTKVAGNRTETVDGSEKIEIAGNRNEKVSGMEVIEIGGIRQETVEGSEIMSVKGSQVELVDGTQLYKVGGSQGEKIGGSRVAKVGGPDLLKCDSVRMVKATGPITIKSSAMITLKVGGSKIVIGPSGIQIKGPTVKIQAQAMAQLKAPTTKIEGSAMLQAKAGGMAQVKSSGLLQMQGSITLIN